MNGERMDLRHAVGVLMSNRDLLRRLAAEARAENTAEPQAEDAARTEADPESRAGAGTRVGPGATMTP